MAEGLNCMSCGVVVPPSQGKLFAQVFCCPVCHQQAERFMERGDRDLASLRSMLSKAVQRALLEGNLQEAVGVSDLSNVDFITKLTGLVEEAKKKRWQDTTPSGKSTPLVVPTAGSSKS